MGEVIELKFKDEKVFGSMVGMTYHRKAVVLLYDIIEFCKKNHLPVPTITSAWREKRIHPRDSGIHCTIPCRAFDLRSKDYTADQIAQIETYVNRWWIYDTDRPHMRCVMCHDVGFGMHFHFQVHPKTIRRTDEQGEGGI